MGIHACLHPMPSCCTSSQVQVKLSDGLDNLNCNHTSCAALRTVDKLPCGYLGTVFWVKFTLEREWAKTTWLSLCQMRARVRSQLGLGQQRSCNTQAGICWFLRLLQRHACCDQSLRVEGRTRVPGPVPCADVVMKRLCYTEKAPNAWQRRGTQMS